MEQFHNIHAGGTVLLVGNGENLRQTPPAWFDFPSFGMNTIHKYAGWKPTYYTAVDSRVMNEFGKEIAEKYKDIPKFVPRPNLDDWHGDNFYRFYHRPGALFPRNGMPMHYDKLMTESGISYGNIMHVALQIAAWMGFTRLLIVGMEHKPLYAKSHFWGTDDGMHEGAPVQQWLNGYKEIVQHMNAAGIEVLNISENTFVSEDIIPRDDWRNYASKNESSL